VLFWAITAGISGQPIGPIFKGHLFLGSSTLEDGPMGPIFKGHLFLGFSTLEDGTDGLSRNVCKVLLLLSA
jgi:hypothetical protein